MRVRLVPVSVDAGAAGVGVAGRGGVKQLSVVQRRLQFDSHGVFAAEFVVELFEEVFEGLVVGGCEGS